jgi:hypothetical protein
MKWRGGRRCPAATFHTDTEAPAALSGDDKAKKNGEARLSNVGGP